MPSLISARISFTVSLLRVFCEKLNFNCTLHVPVERSRTKYTCTLRTKHTIQFVLRIKWSFAHCSNRKFLDYTTHFMLKINVRFVMVWHLATIHMHAYAHLISNIRKVTNEYDTIRHTHVSYISIQTCDKLWFQSDKVLWAHLYAVSAQSSCMSSALQHSHFYLNHLHIWT